MLVQDHESSRFAFEKHFGGFFGRGELAILPDSSHPSVTVVKGENHVDIRAMSDDALLVRGNGFRCGTFVTWSKSFGFGDDRFHIQRLQQDITLQSAFTSLEQSCATQLLI